MADQSSYELPIPEVGQAVRVRNRLATVRAVEPYDTRTQGRLNIVEVEYLDDFRYPEAEQLLWEVESTAMVLGKTSLPRVDENRPDTPGILQAFINAHRWTRLNRLRETEGIEDEPIPGVWNSAIQVHYYQLDPVIRALFMPRVALLLADGVGLGKTIQCGLVTEELLLRRRIRRILIICPAMLQRQWKYEMKRKFNLDFEIIDSDSTFQLRRRMGIDTNPWKAFPSIITSMDYLRMPDVLQQFLQASGVGPDAESDGRTMAHAPWDLLMVDECHHFAPQSGGRASQRTRMLREIRFLFEHRIFASATPHNGKTVSFTGLLELLDPIRFQMDVQMDDKDKANLAEVRIRRLKDDINKQSIRPPFAEQLDPVEIPVRMSDQESALFNALREYRKRGHAALARASSAERWVGEFVYSLLTKRLLSCPYALARTWWRHLEESDDAADLFDMARVSAERAEEQVRSDDEKTTLEEDAARYAGAWFRSQGQSQEELLNEVNKALEALGLGRKTVEDEGKLAALARKSDSKTEALVHWIKKNLFMNGKLRDDERLLIFTEYKEPLLFLEQRLLQEGFDKNTLRLLYGGMPGDDFDAVKAEFEDPAAVVRVLLATDAVGSRTDRMELVFDSALVEEEISGRRVLRLKKHQALMRLAHPIMRQAMATLCRQLHDPDGHNAIFRWSIAALHRSGFEALLVFHYTITAINELREPLHDEVVASVFRVEGNRLTPVEDDFERVVLSSEFHPIKSRPRLDDWWRVLRGHWLQHKDVLEKFLRSQEGDLQTILQRRADATLNRELQAAKESYQHRLRELQDRSREQALRKIARELVQQRVEAQQLALFDELQQEAEMEVQELEQQMEPPQAGRQTLHYSANGNLFGFRHEGFAGSISVSRPVRLHLRLSERKASILCCTSCVQTSRPILAAGRYNQRVHYPFSHGRWRLPSSTGYSL